MQSPNQNIGDQTNNKMISPTPGTQKSGDAAEGEKSWRFNPQAAQQSGGADKSSELSADSDSDSDSDESTDDAEDVTGNPEIGANQNQREESSKNSSVR